MKNLHDWLMRLRGIKTEVKNSSDSVITATIQYPQLTHDILDELVDRLANMISDARDCEMIDHYMTSIGRPGILKKILRKAGVFSFDEVEDALNLFANPDFGKVSGGLLACLVYLKKCVVRGEKIY